MHLLRLSQPVQDGHDPLARQGNILLNGRTNSTKVIH